MIMEIWFSLLDLIYPSNIYCINCGRPIDDRFPTPLPGLRKAYPMGKQDNLRLLRKVYAGPV